MSLVLDRAAGNFLANAAVHNLTFSHRVTLRVLFALLHVSRLSHALTLSQVVFFSDGLEGPSVSHPRLVVNAGDDSHVAFTQSYLSQGGVCLANGLTRILLGRRANVVRCRGSDRNKGRMLNRIVEYNVNVCVHMRHDKKRSVFCVPLVATGPKRLFFFLSLAQRPPRVEARRVVSFSLLCASLCSAARAGCVVFRHRQSPAGADFLLCTCRTSLCSKIMVHDIVVL